MRLEKRTVAKWHQRHRLRNSLWKSTRILSTNPFIWTFQKIDRHSGLPQICVLVHLRVVEVWFWDQEWVPGSTWDQLGYPDLTLSWCHRTSSWNMITTSNRNILTSITPGELKTTWTIRTKESCHDDLVNVAQVLPEMIVTGRIQAMFKTLVRSMQRRIRTLSNFFRQGSTRRAL